MRRNMHLPGGGALSFPVVRKTAVQDEAAGPVVAGRKKQRHGNPVADRPGRVVRADPRPPVRPEGQPRGPEPGPPVSGQVRPAREAEREGAYTVVCPDRLFRDSEVEGEKPGRRGNGRSRSGSDDRGGRRRRKRLSRRVLPGSSRLREEGRKTQKSHGPFEEAV